MHEKMQDTNKQDKKLTRVFIAFSIVFGLLVGMMATYSPNTHNRYQTATTKTNSASQTQMYMGSLESNGIYVESVKPLQVINSPIEISGKVTREKYPSNNFRAKIIDNNGNVLGMSDVQTSGDDAIADFKSNVEFETQDNAMATIYLEDTTRLDDGTLQFSSYKIPVRVKDVEIPQSAEPTFIEMNYDEFIEKYPEALTNKIF